MLLVPPRLTTIVQESIQNIHEISIQTHVTTTRNASLRKIMFNLLGRLTTILIKKQFHKKKKARQYKEMMASSPKHTTSTTQSTAKSHGGVEYVVNKEEYSTYSTFSASVTQNTDDHFQSIQAQTPTLSVNLPLFTISILSHPSTSMVLQVQVEKSLQPSKAQRPS